MRQPFIVAVFISAAVVAAVSPTPATVDAPTTGISNGRFQGEIVAVDTAEASEPSAGHGERNSP